MQKSAIERVRQALCKQREATRPQLAQATGLSLVSCNRAIAELCRLGEATCAGSKPSGGGRPVLSYKYNMNHAYSVYLRFLRQGSLILGTLEISNMQGDLIYSRQAEFAYVREESLNEWLHSAIGVRKLCGIVLEMPDDIIPLDLLKHLEANYHCPARLINTADALNEKTEGELTIYFCPGQAPVCSLWRHELANHSGELGLLPMPTTWEELNYSDHTLLEEMVARLISILICTLAPNHITLYAPFWSGRLTRRILYNVSAKLRHEPPALHFYNISPGQAAIRLRNFASACFSDT